MATADRPFAAHGGRFVYSYGIIVLLVIVVPAVVFPLGSRLGNLPSLPRVAIVDGPARACLGDGVRIDQAGKHVKIESVGDGDVGAHGTLRLSLTCREGTEWAGAPAVLVAATNQVSPEGVVRVGDDELPFTLREADVGALDVAEERRPRSDVADRAILSLAVLVIVARVFGALFVRLRQPRVIGEMVAGLALGPSVLGALAPGVGDYLFPPSVVDTLAVIAQVGLVLFMFTVGLELDMDLVRGSGPSAALISHFSIVLPMSLGLLLALAVYSEIGAGDFVAFALFTGAAMAVTAFPVLARIIADAKLQNTRLGVLALSCAAVDDVTAWSVLAVVIAVAKQGSASGVALQIALALAFAAVLLRFVRPLLGRTLPGLHESAPLTCLGILVTGLMLAAWTAAEIGVHVIFGAFLFGVIVPRSLAADVVRRIEGVTVVLLLPVFFTAVGLSTSIGVLDTPVLWLIGVTTLVVAIVGKWGGSAVAARISGQSWRDANALGALMNTRGLTEIVIVTIGRELGVVSPAFFSTMVLVAIVTTLMTMPSLVALGHAPRLGSTLSTPALPPLRLRQRSNGRVLKR